MATEMQISTLREVPDDAQVLALPQPDELMSLIGQTTEGTLGIFLKKREDHEKLVARHDYLGKKVSDLEAEKQLLDAQILQDRKSNASLISSIRADLKKAIKKVEDDSEKRLQVLVKQREEIESMFKQGLPGMERLKKLTY